MRIHLVCIRAKGFRREEKRPLRHEHNGVGRDRLPLQNRGFHHFSDRAAGRADAKGLVECGTEESAAVDQVPGDFVFDVARVWGIRFVQLGEDFGADC